MLLVSIGRLAQFALLLLTLRLATGYLTPPEMGKVSLVTATVAFFALLLLNPVGMFMNRRLHAWDSRGLAKTYISYFWRYLFIVCLCAAFTLVVLDWLNIWSPSLGMYWMLFLVCGNLLFGTVNQVVIPGLNMFGHRGWFTALTVATAATSLVMAVLFVQILPTAEYWLTGLLLGQLIVGLTGKKIFFGKLQQNPGENGSASALTQAHLKALAGFAWPVAIAVGLGWVQSQGYRYLMEGRLGLAELGLFVAGFGISSGLISGFESIFSTYFQPKFYRRISEDNPDEQSRAWVEYAQAILPALLLTSLFIVAVAPELTKLLLGVSYRQSTQFVVWGAFAELARIATSVFGMAAHARMNTRMLLLPNFAGAVAAVLLIWFLTPVYGSNGVGLGLVLSSTIALLSTVYISGRYLAMAVPPKHFVKSAAMGVALWATAAVIGQLANQDDSHFMALARLCAIGSLFLLFQYLMLLPVLKAEASRPSGPGHD